MKNLKMKSQNEYIGDDSFQKMLNHYACPTSLNVIKMRFIGAICSPNIELRPTDVISSFWPSGSEPRLETKSEAELFFKFFMGLWDEMFLSVKINKVKLIKVKADSLEAFGALCLSRYNEIESGFVEGFWGGKENLKLPAYIAEIIDSMSELASIYTNILHKLAIADKLEDISAAIKHTDRMVEKAIDFIIENSVLPRIDDLKRTMN